jgi:hypothetical protein
MRDDVQAVLDEAQEALNSLSSLYQQSLDEKQLSPRLKTRIKTVLDHQRSALEFTARDITHRVGSPPPGSKIYFPVVSASSSFAARMKGVMPGVAQARPDIETAIEVAQAYHPGNEWIMWLNDLSNENKHEGLSPQSRVETRRVEITGPAGSVSYTPFTPGQGGVRFGPGVYINGVPIDPSTQMPVPNNRVQTKAVIYVDWLFDVNKRSASGTLNTIQARLTTLLQDLYSLL